MDDESGEFRPNIVSEQGLCNVVVSICRKLNLS